jgi:hypothetical protein
MQRQETVGVCYNIVMDFLERYLHITPDGGSGATEAIYIAVVVLMALALVLRRELTCLVRRGLLRQLVVCVKQIADYPRRTERG